MDRVITCGAAVEQLWAFLDHELDDRDQRAVEAHLAFCRRCCGEMEFAKHLRRLPVFEHRPSMHDRGEAPEVTLTPASDPLM